MLKSWLMKIIPLLKSHPTAARHSVQPDVVTTLWIGPGAIYFIFLNLFIYCYYFF